MPLHVDTADLVTSKPIVLIEESLNSPYKVAIQGKYLVWAEVMAADSSPLNRLGKTSQASTAFHDNEHPGASIGQSIRNRHASGSRAEDVRRHRAILASAVV
jgi:hypothetical protein